MIHRLETGIVFKDTCILDSTRFKLAWSLPTKGPIFGFQIDMIHIQVSDPPSL